MTTEPDGLLKAMNYCAGYCEQVAHDGIMPSRDWFAENAPTMRLVADALSAAQRSDAKLAEIIEEMRAEGPRYKSHDLGFVDSVSANRVDEWADDLAALLSERSPQQEKADGLPVSHSVSAENQPPERDGQR